MRQTSLAWPYLMARGVLHGEFSIPPGSRMQIGRALLSADEARAARQGRLLELWHAFGDCLWALAPGRAIPNPGFDAAAGRVTATEVRPPM